MQEYYLKNKERINNRNRLYYRENKEKILATCKSWQERNPEKVKEYRRKINKKRRQDPVIGEQEREATRVWRKNNPDKIKAYSKKYWQENKAAITERSREKKKEYVKKNIVHIREIKRKSLNKRMDEDPTVKLSRRISTAVYQCIKSNKQRKSVFKILGYSIGQLKQYLEEQFTTGMTWDNYGEWHIDHKVPKSAHNFTTAEDIDFKRCWALDNLQPMWAKENLSKGASLHKPFQPSLLL